MNNKFIGLGFLTIILGLLTVGCSATTSDVQSTPTPAPTLHAVDPTAEGIDAPTKILELTPTMNERSDRDYSQYEIITLLPQDRIPAIDDPQFLSSDEADAEYAPDELILGVSFNGDSRAYSVSLLSRHEIVNDIVGGKPISVTW